MKVLILSPDPSHHEYFANAGHENLFNPEEFHQFCHRQIASYSRIVDDLGTHNRLNWAWWATSLSSRNIFFSQLFLNFCYYQYAIDKEKQTRPDLIFCHLKELKSSLQLSLAHSHIESAEKYFRRPWKVLIKEILIFNWLSAVKSFFIRNLYLKAAAFLSKSKKLTPLSDKSLLIDTFIHDESFRQRTYQDSYFGQLHQNLSHNSTVYLPYHAFSRNFADTFKEMRQSDRSFIIPEDYLHLIDYVRAIFKFTRVILKNLSYIKSESLRPFYPLLKRELCYSFSANNVDFTLRYLLIERLSKKGLSPKAYLDWFEGQPLDKIQFIALKKYSPGCSIYSYVGAFYSYPQGISFACTNEEKNQQASYDKLYLQGHALTDYQTSILPSAAPIDVAPAFRISADTVPEVRGNTILLALPNMLPSALGLLDFVVKAELSTRELLISVHPRMNQSLLRMAFDRLAQQGIKITMVPNLSRGLEACSVLITCGTSAFVEAFRRKVPCVVPGNQTELTLNFIPDEFRGKIFDYCWSPTLLEKTLGEMQAKSKHPDFELFLKNYVAFPSEAAIQSFVQKITGSPTLHR